MFQNASRHEVMTGTFLQC